MLLMAGVLGLGVYAGGKMQWFRDLDAKTLDQIYTKLLLPVMFFFAFVINTHLADRIGWEVAYAYTGIISVLFWLSFILMSFIPALKEDRATHALNMGSNHVMMITAPLAGLLLGMDAIPVIVFGMLTQCWFIMVSVFTVRKPWNDSLEVLSRYYRQTLWVWIAIVAGMLGAHLPWNYEVLQFYADGFDWMCLLNTLFISLIMATKSLSIKHSLRSSGMTYGLRLLLIGLMVVMLGHFSDFDEIQMSLLVMMLLAPGMMVRGHRIESLSPVGMYWKEMIAGCNIWYMIMMVVVVLLPQLFI